MSPTLISERNPAQHIRLRAGVVIVILQWLLWFVLPIAWPDTAIFGMLGGLLAAVVILVWWLFFSRVPRTERWGAIALMAVAIALTPRILHPSIVGGMMGMMFGMSVIPGICLALVAGAVAMRHLGIGIRRVALAAAILAACGFWALLRTDGITGEGRSQFAWRWKPTSEQQLLARVVERVSTPAVVPAPAAEKTPEPKSLVESAAAAAPPASAKATAPVRAGGHIDWPGFRGPHRDSVVTGVRIKPEWASTPPVELWRRPVGPAWSSFAVGNGLAYTQEQRGEFEVVSCYDAATGKPVWTHRDTARFWESNAGAGPRGTPTLYGGRIYSMGATGIVNSLDAGSGTKIWTRNAASDTGAKVPEWGLASSPLVVDDLVIIAASGRLAAYDLATGAPQWVKKEGGTSYSSPQLLTIAGVPQIVFQNHEGATAFAPMDGRVLWKHTWEGAGLLQPALTADGGLLITAGDMSGGVGIRRLAVANTTEGWNAKEVWTSKGLKPYFNDFVVHNGHAFGFDGGILSCIDLRDGQRKWKGGRYGHGQMLLLADANLLLVLAEEGELALVSAVPGQFTEIARFPAMQDKTWNHPVMAGDTLLVRNGREMVAFRLPIADR